MAFLVPERAGKRAQAVPLPDSPSSLAGEEMTRD